jgi:hypothetical protein
LTPPEPFDRGTARDDESLLPEGPEVRYAAAETIGADGNRHLGARAQSAAREQRTAAPISAARVTDLRNWT